MNSLVRVYILNYLSTILGRFRCDEYSCVDLLREVKDVKLPERTKGTCNVACLKLQSDFQHLSLNRSRSCEEITVLILQASKSEQLPPVVELIKSLKIFVHLQRWRVRPMSLKKRHELRLGQVTDSFSRREGQLDITIDGLAIKFLRRGNAPARLYKLPLKLLRDIIGRVRYTAFQFATFFDKPRGIVDDHSSAESGN